jgi:molybdenum cofactor cytidylyltransferase
VRKLRGQRSEVRGDTAHRGPVAVVVLAAGGSRRLGTPKQLVRWRGRTLLRRAAEAALACGCGPVTVVLGADAPTMRAELEDLPVHVAVHRRWRAGLSSTLRAGVRAARAASAGGGPDAILFLTCDQPYVTAPLLRRLVRRFRRGASITASAYDRTLGVPAVFAREFFGDLRTLSGDQGAKRLLARHHDVVAPVPFARGGFDVDRSSDLGGPARPARPR